MPRNTVIIKLCLVFLDFDWCGGIDFTFRFGPVVYCGDRFSRLDAMVQKQATSAIERLGFYLPPCIQIGMGPGTCPVCFPLLNVFALLDAPGDFPGTSSTSSKKVQVSIRVERVRIWPFPPKEKVGYLQLPILTCEHKAFLHIGSVKPQSDAE